MKLFGIRFEVSLVCIFILAAMAIIQRSFFALFVGACVVAHEYTHLIVAKKLGYTPEKVSLGIFGGVLQLKESFIKPRHEMMIHISGPCFSLALAGCFYMIQERVLPFVGLYMPAWVYFELSPVIEELLMANMVIGIFNLMPFYPLDGGKITRLYMAFFLGYGRAIKISRFFSIIFSILLFLTGIFLIQYNQFNIIICALAINLLIIVKRENTFFLFKTVRVMEENSGKGQNKSKSEKMSVCRLKERAYKSIEGYRPLANRTFAVVNDRGNFRGQLTEMELLEGIYNCGIYADFDKILRDRNRRLQSRATV